MQTKKRPGYEIIYSRQTCKLFNFSDFSYPISKKGQNSLKLHKIAAVSFKGIKHLKYQL